MILIVDNYDSFTYNVVQALGALGAEVEVHTNDAISPDAALARGPEGIVVSPGPGRPEAAGVSMEVIRRASGVVPILGVCLGHQAIARVFGGRVGHAARLMHGKTSEIRHDGTDVLEGLDDPFVATRYHSLVVERVGFPESDLRVTAWTAEGEIMALAHRTHPTWGVQFHPESVLTPQGGALFASFLRRCGRRPVPVA